MTRLLFYASLLGEMVAWMALALAIIIIAVALNPKLAHGGAFEDRWHQFAVPSSRDAASFINVWDVATSSIEGGIIAGGVATVAPDRPRFRPHHRRRH